MSELDRVLRSTFGKQKPGVRKRTLGDFDPSQRPVEGLTPGISYPGSAAELRRQMGKPPAKEDGPFTPEALEAGTEALKKMYHGFQVHTRPPSHIEAPYSAKPINVFRSPMVALPGGEGAGSFVDVLCYTVPIGKLRAEITHIGHALDLMSSWVDVEWRLLLDGNPMSPYESILVQLWNYSPPTKLPVAIHLQPASTLCLQARTLSSTLHYAAATFGGWVYPVVQERGGSEIASTLVDLS